MFTLKIKFKQFRVMELWPSSNGRISIAAMSDAHLVNSAIKLINDLETLTSNDIKAPSIGGYSYEAWIKAFKKEINSRLD